MTNLEEPPYRVVDITNQGWHLCGTGLYQASYGHSRGLTNRTLDQIPGPWRPVLPITDEDEATLTAVFLLAGRASIATLAAALEQVFHQLREARGGLDNANDSYEYAMRTLTAGREGSWESEVLKEVVLFGNELNLVTPGRGQDNSVAARRRRGPNRRVNVPARDELVALFTRWVTDPRRFTEVAETLAAFVSRFADEHGGADGWKTVADRWLQPGGLAVANFVSCYRLLYSLSEHFDTAVL